jgi:hypothetical protein
VGLRSNPCIEQPHRGNPAHGALSMLLSLSEIHYTWWKSRVSYIRRFIAMLQMRFRERCSFAPRLGSGCHVLGNRLRRTKLAAHNKLNQFAPFRRQTLPCVATAVERKP